MTVERIVDQLTPRAGGIMLPEWVIDAVARRRAARTRHTASGSRERDNEFYKFWDGISRDREAFVAWMHEHVLAEVAHR